MNTNSHTEQQSTAEKCASMLSKIAIQPYAIENFKKRKKEKKKKKRSWTFFLVKMKCVTAFHNFFVFIKCKNCPFQPKLTHTATTISSKCQWFDMTKSNWP